ncbi:MAG: ORF6N domain-containing protein [Prevotellaceae bacterium]|nr:ORF6N domain-containing protein [Prevotellaceae bacterium]
MEIQVIQNKIYEIRGHKVMLDRDLAELYGVETRTLNQAVKRNIDRFPDDFMFQLTRVEWETMSSQFVMTSRSKRPKVSAPYAFTELGIAMLSSVLNSKSAIQINMGIMRAFLTLRQYALGYAELNRKLEDFMFTTDMQFGEIYQALTELAAQKKLDEKPRNPIGFKQILKK